MYTHFTVRHGSLKIENCHVHCPHNYRMRVEVTMPAIEALAVANGGSLRTEGNFRRQREVTVAVSQGGQLDTRSLPADNVTAAVSQGGRILTTARVSLTAAVNSGGIINYYGSPASVTRVVSHGGAIVAGNGREDQAMVAPRPPTPPHPPRAIPAPPGATGDYDEDDTDDDTDEAQ
jgi:hypothetical protein